MPSQIPNMGYKPKHEEIAQRARSIYEKSGRIAGRDEQNWLQAEAELIAAHQRESESKSNSGGKSAVKSPPRQNGGQSQPGQRTTTPTPPFAHRS